MNSSVSSSAPICGTARSWSESSGGSRFQPRCSRARQRMVGPVRAASQQSPYDILGISSKATEREIKQAYRKLALKFHPDVNKAPNAKDKFLSIKNAYQVLVDKKSRSQYDSRQYSSSTRNKTAWDYSTRKQEEFYGLDDFFRDLSADFKKKASTGKPKSLWEELAEIGEEFVEFLEKELHIEDRVEEAKTKYEKNPPSDDEARKSSRSEKKKVNVEEEIDDMLSKLKNEMGL